jgi:hypothetical protein
MQSEAASFSQAASIELTSNLIEHIDELVHKQELPPGSPWAAII